MNKLTRLIVVVATALTACSGQNMFPNEEVETVQQAVNPCFITNVSGLSGVDPTVACGYITSIVANGTSNLSVTYSPCVAAPITTTVSVGSSGGTVTGSWSGTKITSTLVAGNVLKINGVNALTFSAGLGANGSGSSWTTGSTAGVTRITFRPDQADGFRRSIYFEGINNSIAKTWSLLSNTTCTAGVSYDYDTNNDFVLNATADMASSVEFYWDTVSVNLDSSSPFTYTKTGAQAYGHTIDILASFPGGAKLWHSPIGLAFRPYAAPGANTTCMTYRGRVACWGDSSYGATGTNTTSNRATPTYQPVKAYYGAEKVSMNKNGGCYLEMGGVLCWGRNAYGVTGQDPAITTQSLTPHQVMPEGYGVNYLVTGDDFACVGFSSSVECWGRNNRGQLGNGSTTDTYTPTQASLPVNNALYGLSASGDTACAIMGNGGNKYVYCWGRDDWGQCGNGGGAAGTLATPQQVLYNGSALNNIVDVAVGYRHACALNSSGIVYCWGNNQYAQLAKGTADSNTHLTAELASTFATSATSLVAGRNYNTCFRWSNGSVSCVGENTVGELGNNTTSTYSASLVTPTGFTSGLFQFANSSGNVCGFKSGHVYCWGDNTYNQLGDPSAGSVELEPNLLPGF